MIHYIQFNYEYNTWCLYREFQDMRVVITRLSAKDVERIYRDCQKLKADMKQEEHTIDRLIEEELSTLHYLETHIAGTSTHAHLKKEAERRIEYLKKLKETA